MNNCEKSAASFYDSLAEQQSICAEAVANYGKENQLFVAVEELSELQKEVCKSLRNKGSIYRISEEIADVEIMLEQLMIIYDCRKEVDEWRAFKCERLAKRIGNGEE